MAIDYVEVFCRSIQNDQSLCMRCGTRNRLNCWELTVSPCCERSRTTCERCPVFISHLRTTASPLRVMIGTSEGGVLEGTVFLTQGERMSDMLKRGEKLPVDFKDRFIYYVGPVDPVREEVIGPAGPTTATRMDKFTRQMLAETGLLGMVGKAERGPEAIAAIKEFSAVYLMAIGGAAYLVSKAIVGARQLAFADLGMEGIYEFEVRDMPVTVAVDTKGTSVHQTGPAEWQQRIAGIPILQ